MAFQQSQKPRYFLVPGAYTYHNHDVGGPARQQAQRLRLHSQIDAGHGTVVDRIVDRKEKN